MALESLFARYDKLLLFDTETTGLQFHRDEIIEFAAVTVELRNGQPTVTEEYDQLVRVVDQMLDAMYTGVFTYVAHPDLLRFEGDDRLYRQQMRRVVQAAKRCGLPLEINLHGVSIERHYPDERFWELVAEEGGTAILGRDAHSPEEFLQQDTERKMLDMVHRLGLNLVDTIPLHRP